MSPLRWLWLVLAVWGAVHPWLWIARWLDGGGTLAGLPAAWFADAAVAGMAWDLVAVSVALVSFVLAETLVRHNWAALMAIPATLMLGPGCGLPLYLFLRAAPVR